MTIFIRHQMVQKVIYTNS